MLCVVVVVVVVGGGASLTAQATTATQVSLVFAHLERDLGYAVDAFMSINDCPDEGPSWEQVRGREG